ncbi:hypothetical protein GQ85_36335, partial [Rhodococcus rhodochrous]
MQPPFPFLPYPPFLRGSPPPPSTTGRTASLDQYQVAGPQLALEELDRGGGVGDVARLVAPGSFHHRTLVETADRAGRADRDDAGDVQAHREPADGVVLDDGLVTEFAHLPQHRPGPPRAVAGAGHGHQRLERRPHRVRVGVVRVVDDGDAVGTAAHVHSVRRHRTGTAERGRDLLGRGAAL